MRYLVVLAAWVISAHAYAQDLKARLVGVYSIDTIYDELADGKRNDTWGEGVAGSVIFTPSGKFSVQIMANNRQPVAGKGPRDPIGPIVTYYGIYTVDEPTKTLTYHIQRSSFPPWNDFDRKATIADISATSLTILTPVKGDPKLGDFIAHLSLHRDGL